MSNRLGVPIRWAIGTEPPRELGCEKGRNIASWDWNAGSELMNFFGSSSHNTMSVFLENSDTPTLRRLPIDGARVICFKTPSDEVLVYQIRYEMGSRVLEVRSNVVLSSHLDSIALAVYAGGEAAGVLDAGGS